MVTHSSILAWIILWTGEPGDYSPWDHRVGHDLATRGGVCISHREGHNIWDIIQSFMGGYQFCLK